MEENERGLRPVQDGELNKRKLKIMLHTQIPSELHTDVQINTFCSWNHQMSFKNLIDLSAESWFAYDPNLLLQLNEMIFNKPDRS